MHLDDVRRDFGRIARRLGRPSMATWPSVITLHPTDVCNHECSWCWFERSSASFSVADVKRFLETLIENGLEEVIVSGGGEPLLHAQFEELCEFLGGQKNLRKRLYTNGSLLRKQLQGISAFDYVRVSMDAGTPQSYAQEHRTTSAAFHEILDAAVEVEARGSTVGVSMVMNGMGAEAVDQMAAECDARGIRFLFVKPVMSGLLRNESVIAPVLGRGTRVLTYCRSETGAPSGSVPPPVIANMSITLNADNCVYPCCHFTSEDWRIWRVLRPLVLYLFRTQYDEISERYAEAPHACRVHDSWSAWQRMRGVAATRGAAVADSITAVIGKPAEDAARVISAFAVREKLKTVAVSGPSAVGKSTFARAIADSKDGDVAILPSDNFLRPSLRGERGYRKDDDGPLEPADYDFADLSYVMDSLLQGHTVARSWYQRGVGWQPPAELVPANTIIVEGLFLDSVEATDELLVDLLIVMEAPLSAIAQWRRVRDSSVRTSSQAPFRTQEETEREIAKTIVSYHDYTRRSFGGAVLLLKLDENHMVTAIEHRWP